MQTRIPVAAWTITFCLFGAAGLQAQADKTDLPFAPGEELIYQVQVSPFGKVGRGTLGVENPGPLRGQETYLLRFDFSAKVGFFKGSQRSRSWIDPATLSVLRFHKQEKKPLARDESEEVEIYPEEQRWTAASGQTGRSPTAEPLDELSFLYYVRTLPLLAGAEYHVDRHFDPRRNPVVIRVVGREVIQVPAGTFSALIVEMNVRDPERYQGEGQIRMHLLDDEFRTPLRIETSLPQVGQMVLELESTRSADLQVSPGR